MFQLVINVFFGVIFVLLFVYAHVSSCSLLVVSNVLRNCSASSLLSPPCLIVMVLRDSWTSVGIRLALLVCVCVWWREGRGELKGGGFTQAVKLGRRN